MANTEESSPLLGNPPSLQEEDDKKTSIESPLPVPSQKQLAPPPPAASIGYPADGLPLGYDGVITEPIRRNQWNSSLFNCLGRNDEFCSSDLEVCLLGAVAPCVLYGSNVERLNSTPGTFTNHCMPYSVLYVLGTAIFGGNLLARWFSYPSRTAIRRKFNLEGNFESVVSSCGCCGSVVEDDVQREQWEMACDFATHVFCHACALCQEGREVRRRVPHPGLNLKPILVMIPPCEQFMSGREKV
ncbi:cell number regulator 8 [Impatiens glandulifera]|uniref:cell number regulator 8 n=1 Tax=Impatiens glandulifera TaxID=253017 RepID=UPI001FB0C9E0|nr:cell number regulator 8 [Impatiens glandulifera]